MIGIIRRILDALLLNTRSEILTHDVLNTFIAELCMIIYSRPLVTVSTGPKSPLITHLANLQNTGHVNVNGSVKALAWTFWSSRYCQLDANGLVNVAMSPLEMSFFSMKTI